MCCGRMNAAGRPVSLDFDRAHKRNLTLRLGRPQTERFHRSFTAFGEEKIFGWSVPFMKLGTLVRHVHGYQRLPQILQFLPRDLAMVFQSRKKG